MHPLYGLAGASLGLFQHLLDGLTAGNVARSQCHNNDQLHGARNVITISQDIHYLLAIVTWAASVESLELVFVKDLHRRDLSLVFLMTDFATRSSISSLL